MTNCKLQREPIIAQMLGELDAAASAAVQAHLAGCPDCQAWAKSLRREEEELEKVFGRLAAPPSSVGPPRPTSKAQLRATSPTAGRRYRRAWWLPAVAAAGILVVIGLWPGEHGATRAYGMSAAIAAMRNSTLHVRGEVFIPLNPEPTGTDALRADYESWVDPVHGRSRRTYYFYEVSSAPKNGVSLGERIIDGDYRMTRNDTEKWVEYARLDDFHRKLEQRAAADDLFKDVFRDEADKFVQIGEKAIGGVKFAVWKLEEEEPLIGTAERMQCAVNPRTGEFGEVLFWRKWRVQKDWQPCQKLTLFERGVAIPDSVFDTTPPAGYTLKNTKETAVVPPLCNASGEGNGLEYKQYISFKLPDGSVLLGWGSRDVASDASQEPLFADLEFGGPLPELPIVYTAVRQQYEDKEVVYTGRHLAYTQDGDGFHEWSLYVAPEANALPRSWTFHLVIYRFNLPEDRLAPFMFLNVSSLILIDGPQDFNDLVRGAMAELSETGQPPHGITYERVMQLTREVRAESAGQ